MATESVQEGLNQGRDHDVPASAFSATALKASAEAGRSAGPAVPEAERVSDPSLDSPEEIGRQVLSTDSSRDVNSGLTPGDEPEPKSLDDPPPAEIAEKAAPIEARIRAERAQEQDARALQGMRNQALARLAEAEEYGSEEDITQA